MSFRAIVTSDLHVDEEMIKQGILSKLSVFLEEQRVVHKANVLIILGDFFHQHQDPARKTSFGIMDAAADFFHSLEFKKIVLLKGNHDESMIGFHNLKIFSLDPRVQIIDSPTQFIIGSLKLFFIPFIKDYSHFQSVLSEAPEDSIIMMHQTVKGFMLNSKKPADNGVEITKYFPLVLSGDLHDYQTKGNIIYVGSPYQTRRNELVEKYMFIMTEDSINTITVPTSVSQRYIFVEDLEDIDSLDLKGKIVVITGDEPVDSKKVEELRQKGIKVVSTTTVMESEDMPDPTDLDLSGFSTDVLQAIVDAARDPYFKQIGEDIISNIRVES